MKSNRNIFVRNGLKAKQSESKEKQAHTTKRNVCVMYSKYVHCTHTHTRTHALADVHMDMFYSEREQEVTGGHINILFSVCCAPFTTCYFARLPDYKNEAVFMLACNNCHQSVEHLISFRCAAAAFTIVPTARWNNERETYAERREEVILFAIKTIFINVGVCVKTYINFSELRRLFGDFSQAIILKIFGS